MPNQIMIDEDVLLSRGAVYRKVKKGEFIFLEGYKCNYYYQLVSGRVSWINYDEDGNIFIQSIIEPGECFGELPLFDDLPYAASARAETDSVIIQLQKPVFLNLLKEKPELHFDFSRLLTSRVRFKFFVLKEVACCNPEHRIVALLNYIRQKNFNTDEDASDFVVAYTRQQIAGMTGLRVETVIRVIRKLEEKGKLVIDKGKIILPHHDWNHKMCVQ